MNTVLVSIVFFGFFYMQRSVYGAPQVPCFFIFGDSLVDSGNNNPLPTSAKANYPPYGIDFPSGPTGRFCNGKTVADFLGENLGLDGFIPPFTNSGVGDILRGVNYASGSAGIRDETGQHLGVRVSMNGQLRNHKIIVDYVETKLKSKEAALEHLSNCLYYAGLGSNDYINNYFLGNLYKTCGQYTPEAYATALVDQYSQQLKTLHSYGARKFALIGIGNIGCTPHATENGSKGFCVDNINSAAVIFNEKLKLLVGKLNSELIDAKFIFVNTSGMILEQTQGFKVANVGCCKVSDLGLCDAIIPPCPNRTEYVFWDAYHPTEAMNQITASRAYKAEIPSDAFPFGISQLVAIKNLLAAAAPTVKPAVPTV